MESTKAIFEKYKPTHVIHLAARVRAQARQQINPQAPRFVVSACDNASWCVGSQTRNRPQVGVKSMSRVPTVEMHIVFIAFFPSSVGIHSTECGAITGHTRAEPRLHQKLSSLSVYITPCVLACIISVSSASSSCCSSFVAQFIKIVGIHGFFQSSAAHERDVGFMKLRNDFFPINRLHNVNPQSSTM